MSRGRRLSTSNGFSGTSESPSLVLRERLTFSDPMSRRRARTDCEVPDAVETMLEAIGRLREDGFLLDWLAVSGGRLRTVGSNDQFDAREATVNETVRFEGHSNPADEGILIAIVAPGGRRGLYSSAYGPDATPDDAAVLQAIAMP